MYAVARNQTGHKDMVKTPTSNIAKVTLTLVEQVFKHTQHAVALFNLQAQLSYAGTLVNILLHCRRLLTPQPCFKVARNLPKIATSDLEGVDDELVLAVFCQVLLHSRCVMQPPVHLGRWLRQWKT